MTGEVTLRGLVLPVASRRRSWAAHRAGIKRVIMPARCEKDLVDVPEQARKELEFVFATHMEEVLAAALEENPVGRKPPTPGAAPQRDPQGRGGPRRRSAGGRTGWCRRRPCPGRRRAASPC